MTLTIEDCCGRMVEGNNTLDMNDMTKALMDCGRTERQKALAKRYLMTWNTDMTDEQAERLLRHDAFVKDILKEYMRKELEAVLLQIDRIGQERRRKEKMAEMELLLSDLKLRLPDLIDLLN